MADKWKKTALLVIDMQKDFVDEDGQVRVDGAKSIVPNVIDAVETARKRGILVIWSLEKSTVLYKNNFIKGCGALYINSSADTIFLGKVVREHDPQGRDVELFRRHFYSGEKPGPTSKGSVGAELAEGLVIREGDYKLVKTRFSAFFATPLHSILQGIGINRLVIAGVQTPNCIRQTVFDAVALDYPSVTVLIDATAAATPEIHLANIVDMRNVGVSTPTLQEWSQH